MSDNDLLHKLSYDCGRLWERLKILTQDCHRDGRCLLCGGEDRHLTLCPVLQAEKTLRETE